MDTTPNGWNIIDNDAGVLSYEYSFNSSGSKSNMFAARMGDGCMVVLSPGVGLSEAAFGELLGYGAVGAVVATNGFHHLGIAEWRKRFPKARFFAPEKATTRIGKKNREAGEFESMEKLMPLLGPDVGIRDFEGTKCGETAAWAKTATGYAWFASDLLANLPALPNSFPLRMLFKLTKSAPGFRVFNLAVKFIIKDRKGVFAQFLKDLKSHPPSVIVPAHGAPIASDNVAEEAYALVASRI